MASKRGALGTLLFVLIAACQEPVSAPRQNDEQSGISPQTSLTIDTGFVLRDGMPVRVVFEIRGGRAVFEGDIDLGPANAIPRSLEELQLPGGVQLGAVHNNLGRRWPSGRVPYVIESSFPNPQRALDAMAHIQSHVAGVIFQPRAYYDGDYVLFRRTTDPSICGQSSVGKVGGGQTLLVQDNCATGPVIHELGHALGFWHEQSRCDRDTYVEILYANIQFGRADQFDKHCSDGSDLESYDEGSIMHYGRFAFGIVVNGVTQQTIRSRRGLDALMGQLSGLSTIDIFTVNRMYKPFGPGGVSVSYPNGRPTVAWNASNGATNYTVNLVIVYEEYDDYSGTSTIFDHSTEGVGVTANLSIADTQHGYTGSERCFLYSEVWGSASYAYYYEVTASFPNGVVSSGTRWPAMVAPAYPC